MRRLLKRLVKLAILVAVANVVLQLARRAFAPKPYEPPIEPAWPTPKIDEAPAPAPAAVAVAEPAAEVSTATAWVAPNGSGDCPHGYPVKVKVASGIYHLPGGRAYERTKPDRCYATPQAAEADGYRAAKR